MKIKREELIKYIVIGISVLIVFIVIIILLSKNKDTNNINLNKVSDNHMVDDSMVMALYERFNPERELLFNLIGSNNNKDYYGYYYKDNSISYKDLDDVVKNTILINDADYTTGKLDKENECYNMSVSDFKVIYEKLYGKKDYNLKFNDKYEIDVKLEDDNLCIKSNSREDYTKVIDTYMVNAITDKNIITIYERVAFIKISDAYLYFYKDYEMKDLVYKLKVTKKLDRSFINNEKVVSNVLLKYQDKFDLYEYTYKEGKDSYYFESVKR